MSKKFWEVFPLHTRRRRRVGGRGRDPTGNIISLPTEEQFFKALYPTLVYKSYTDKSIDKFMAVYQYNDKYGLISTSWCGCNSCINPIKGCFSVVRLQLLIEDYDNCIVWYDTIDQLLQASLVSLDKRFVDVIKDYISKL